MTGSCRYGNEKNGKSGESAVSLVLATYRQVMSTYR